MSRIHNTALILAFFAMGSIALAQPTFINKIPIPPLLDASAGTIQLEISEQLHMFNPGDTSDHVLNGSTTQAGIQTWAYNELGSNEMSILGPTLLWTTGSPINIEVTNNVTQETTVHWHGAEIPAAIDGGPHDPFGPTEVWPVSFVNLDSSSTMWYHPHVHNNTYPQVQMGLSGMVISRQANDPINSSLPNFYGVDDIPLVIGDLGVNIDTIAGMIEVVIDTLAPPAAGKRPINLVNGVTNPYYDVRPHMLRLRILNGSTRKGIQFGISPDNNSSQANLRDFYLVATDGGYTLSPSTHKTLVIGPGARAEIVVDLTNESPGTNLYLRNLKELMPGYIVGSPNNSTGPGGSGGGKDSTSGFSFLEMRVVSDTLIPGYTFTDAAPSFSSPWDPSLADENGITGIRTKNLVRMVDSTGANLGFMIDGTTYHMDSINDIVCVNAKEIWEINNLSAVAHPFHIHKIFFRVLSIDSVVNGVTLASINLEERGLNGPKDDVLILPNWHLRFLAKFDDYPSAIMPHLTYMYHCHILTHEDGIGGGMMHQFVVTDEGPCILGIEEVEPQRFTMYPNPATSELYIEAPDGGQLSILDMQGHTVLQETLSEGEGVHYLRLNKLGAGMYLVELEQNGQKATKKLVLN